MPSAVEWHFVVGSTDRFLTGAGTEDAICSGFVVFGDCLKLLDDLLKRHWSLEVGRSASHETERPYTTEDNVEQNPGRIKCYLFLSIVPYSIPQKGRNVSLKFVVQQRSLSSLGRNQLVKNENASVLIDSSLNTCFVKPCDCTKNVAGTDRERGGTNCGEIVKWNAT